MATPTKPRKKKPTDLFGAGVTGELMQGKYTANTQVLEWFQRRHARGRTLIDKDGYYRRVVDGRQHKWKVPYGVRDGLNQRLTFSQIASKYPFYVTWTSPRTRLRLRRKFSSLPHAIDWIACRVQYHDDQASIICRNGFYIPRKLMGKFPRQMTSNGTRRTYYWCPCCMEPRVYRRTGQEFFGRKKFPRYDKQGEPTGGYEWRDVRLAVLACSVCGLTNRDSKFRASNQPVEIKRIKQGVRRVRRRR